ncbi:MAG: glycine--tRNA ligase [Candidatus Raymondbacteria bacterium RifOxyA12_full_50_37]|uniref:Glycine--tRNA ligase n=1 Tax=Candidatus Raymondbacteria bacterium RIFOXYD12_FULL_49_13 TaxID=1817890 RepID=A0A1F7FCH4_UNCRA|nr:MAG: glycine--tRNA ligase [Candidatus Raymondbacteria bacterium RifOxyA12_full_50_37]OGJ86279.1 MAG: glycine--tRNA ligase [Candidatus Raymondbacteria bacterium RIFOXYA2_FULL_49_16]OGJ93617.1 MAG: glycine--tRNA ligase [Candidatus Raymondbacteria bacterium RifOxyC12_full_50_8]OGJ95816.1 MAG: glycine--tRNA ligase [Candidatus Raymondbacteria bacterium RIFOXYC2_FULL_50_21]OGJ99053.1 MAG: glycine--tRNA ligase [Candidatus Raymondbacteria bacterium RifOxyB12_full_50_8]OGK04384.1 MAG: glycine--tRNA 
MAQQKTDMKQVVSLCKRRGFIFPGSEIYGGLANTWDYGPYGCEFKNNVKREWWRSFVLMRDDVVGLDSPILLNPKVWEASGHLKSFADPLMDCRDCKERVRGDQLIEAKLGDGASRGMDFKAIYETIVKHDIRCPRCGNKNFTEPRAFNLMFKTFQGVIEDATAVVYMRPETAQGIFLEFKNVVTTCRQKVPFGIGQIGKAFRNEITPGNFIFRTREFEQMELEFFCKPGSEIEWFEYWKTYCTEWLYGLGLKKEKMRVRNHEKDELSHYSNATCDIEYEFPFGWGEMWGIASRTDFDLKAHMTHSGEDLQYIDQAKNEKYVPYVIEPSLGVDRCLLTFLIDAYDEDEIEGEKRIVLRLHPRLAPVKAAILPLLKKEPVMPLAEKIFKDLIKSGKWNLEFDESGSIGKRYRRQDELGTPFCFTVDFDSLNDNKVTIRDRDTLKQERVDISAIQTILQEKIEQS